MYRRPIKIVLNAGETLFIPSSWSYAIKSREGNFLTIHFKAICCSTEVLVLTNERRKLYLINYSFAVIVGV